MSTALCPECGQVVPADPGWVTWCDGCGWNVTAGSTAALPRTALDRWLDRAGRAVGMRVLSELKRRETLEPRPTAARALAYLIALVVELLALAVIVGAVALATLSFPNPFGVAAAVVMLGLGWLIRPRLGRLPRENVLRRQDSPALYAIVDEVAAAMQTRPPTVIVVDDQLNANWSVRGVRRRAVLTLGLPLFELLDADRRVALIAHELAHGRNGDQRRGLVVGSALSTLEELYLALTPRETMLRYTGLAAGELLGNLLGWLLSQPVKWLLYLELHLLLHDMQRAEYLADALAASAAGTDAMISLHETLLMSSVVSTTLARAAREQRDPGELFDQMRDDIDAVPARERERRIRAAEQEGTKLGSTHPPTAMRIDLLRSRPAERRRVTLTPEASHRIDVELDEKLVSCAQRLLDRQRDSLYAR